MILNPITNRKVKENGPTGKKIYKCLKEEKDKISRKEILKELKGEKILDIEKKRSWNVPNPPKIGKCTFRDMTLSQDTIPVYLDFLSRKYPYLCSILNTIELSFNTNQRLDKTICISLYRSRIIVPELVKNHVKKCIKEKKRFVAIPVLVNFDEIEDLNYSLRGHANALIYDTIKKELEHYEPQEYIKNDKRFEKALKGKKFVEIIAEIFNKDIGSGTVKKYFDPIKTCPNWLQQLQQDEIYSMFNDKNYVREAIKLKMRFRLRDKDGNGLYGFCVYWCLFYLETRVANPDIDRKIILTLVKSEIKSKTTLTKFIQMYIAFISYIAKKEINFSNMKEDKNRYKRYVSRMNKVFKKYGDY